MSFNKTLIFYVSIFLLFYFVFLDEVTDTYLLKFSSPNFSTISPKMEEGLVYLFLCLQIIFSPIQAGLSDYQIGKRYLRKKSLVFSISITLISVVLFILSSSYGKFLLCLSIILKGTLGNTLPIAWAGVAEITPAKNIRFALALSICALAVGSWGSLLVSSAFTAKAYSIIVTSILAAGLSLAIYPFKDIKDLPLLSAEPKLSPIAIFTNEIKSLYHLSTNGITGVTLISFVFSEISFYQILFRVEIFNNYTCLIFVPISIGVGYTVGTIVLKFITFKDKNACLLGILLSSISIFFLSMLFLFNNSDKYLFTALFALYSFGYAIFTPSLFSLITPRQHPHLQGKTYGLVESSDSLASLVTLILMFNTQHISCDSVLFLSLITIAVSLLFFIHLYKKNVTHH